MLYWDTWTSAGNLNADDTWYEKLGHNYVDTTRLIYADYMKSVVSSGVTEGGDWYVITGGRQDYMTYYQNCREVTIELSNSKILGTEYLQNYWNYNQQSLLNYIKEIQYGFNGTVKNTSSDPLDAKIEITSHDVDNSWVVTDPSNGDYYRPIEPGTNSVTYSAFGHTSQTIDVTVTGWETTTIQNIILDVDPTTNSLSGSVLENVTGTPLENVKIEILLLSLSYEK